MDAIENLCTSQSQGTPNTQRRRNLTRRGVSGDEVDFDYHEDVGSTKKAKRLRNEHQPRETRRR